MRPILLALACLGLAACQNTTVPSVEVSDAVCRPTPNGRDLTGCYLTLTASTEDRLVAVSTSAATEAQIHAVSTEGGVMAMEEMPDGMPLRANDPDELAPGGDHIMLLGVTTPLKPGDTVDLVLTFERSAPVTVTAPVGTPPLP